MNKINIINDSKAMLNRYERSQKYLNLLIPLTLITLAILCFLLSYYEQTYNTDITNKASLELNKSLNELERNSVISTVIDAKLSILRHEIKREIRAKVIFLFGLVMSFSSAFILVTNKARKDKIQIMHGLLSVIQDNLDGIN